MSCQVKRCCVFLLIAIRSRAVSVATRRVSGVSLFVVLLALVSLTTRVGAAETTIRIAAASSLQFALGEVIDTYRTVVHDIYTASNNTVPKIQMVYGSSGNLYRQIVQGAPFDLFLSADDTLVDKLQQQGVTQQEGVEFGHGQLVIAMGKQVAERWPDQSADSLLTALATGNGNSRLVIANPTHAPYGKAAKQFIESLGLWSQLKPKLVYGEKVSQAAQFVTSGAVDVAVISLSLALSIEVDHLPVDPRYHQPIVHKMIVLTEDEDSISRLYHYLTHDAGVAAVFKKYGYIRE